MCPYEMDALTCPHLSQTYKNSDAWTRANLNAPHKIVCFRKEVLESGSDVMENLI